MENASLDLAGLCKWGVDKALGHVESKIGLPLGETLGPLTNGLISSLGIGSVDVDPYMYAIGRLVISGVERQRKIQEARSQANGTG